MNILVFDIETIPDIESGKRLYDLEGLTDKEVAEVMFSRRRQETDGTSDFLRLHLHRVVAISVLLSTKDKLNVWSLGTLESSEADLLQRFYEGIEKYTPRLVSWNGRGFDLPVMHYRALLHGVSASRYWETGANDQGFKWNNYISRYHDRHTDLMDVLAAYEYRAVAPLDQIATMLGFPGKMGMSGDKVWDSYCTGKLAAIRNYCETDVLNTYLVYLRFELMRGHLTNETYATESSRLRQMLREENKPHLTEFADRWLAAPALKN
jgi:predicted PolB exonuclease-like 3'-5' exonuclease